MSQHERPSNICPVRSGRTTADARTHSGGTTTITMIVTVRTGRTSTNSTGTTDAWRRVCSDPKIRNITNTLERNHLVFPPGEWPREIRILVGLPMKPPTTLFAPQSHRQNIRCTLQDIRGNILVQLVHAHRDLARDLNVAICCMESEGRLGVPDVSSFIPKATRINEIIAATRVDQPIVDVSQHGRVPCTGGGISAKHNVTIYRDCDGRNGKG